MLRVTSDEDRLVQDSDILWYDRSLILANTQRYNFYITTDFATSIKQKSDYTVISVWAYDKDRNWFYVDGILKRQDMSDTLNDLFRLVQQYLPQAVGIEKSGQQKGFISWIKREMIIRNVWFTIASDKNSVEEGFTCITDKLTRFNVALPFFKQHKIHFPESMRQEKVLKEAIDEIRSIVHAGIKSRHDDFIDTVSQLPLLNPYVPVEEIKKKEEQSKLAGMYYLGENSNHLDSYLP
jgi:predicted phage terminase large subunit-like protein